MKSYKIDQYFEFTFQTQTFSTGAATDADSTPTYRTYEENNDTVLDSGNCAKRDDTNTTGYYYVRGQCTAALGYEVGKTYEVRVAATVATVAGAAVVGRFTILPALVWDSLYGGTDNLQVDSIQISGTTQTARDIGASVLLSVGTGTGQVNLSSGKVPATLANTDVTGNVAADLKAITVGVDLSAVMKTSVAQSVWNAPLNSYVVDDSMGQVMHPLAHGQVGAATSTTVTLDGDAVGTNEYYDGAIIQITTGTGAGQSRIINQYVGSTKIATITDSWATTPDSNSRYVIRAMGDVEVGVNNDKTGYALTTGERDSIAAATLDLANGVETGLTLRQALRVFAAALAGKVSGAGGATITFRNIGDSKDRIVATVSAGNRTAVTLDLT